MPTRDIKESCRTSVTLAQISAEAERCFWRLITYADDFGRFPGHAGVVRAQCFSVMLEQVSEEQVEVWLAELTQADLIRPYHDGAGRPFAFFPTWPQHQRTRARHSKYPAPPASSVPASASEPRTSASSPRANVTVVTEVPERTVNTDRARPRSASTLPTSGWQNGGMPDVAPAQVKDFMQRVKAQLAGAEPEPGSPF